MRLLGYGQYELLGRFFLSVTNITKRKTQKEIFLFYRFKLLAVPAQASFLNKVQEIVLNIITHHGDNLSYFIIYILRPQNLVNLHNTNMAQSKPCLQVTQNNIRKKRIVLCPNLNKPSRNWRLTINTIVLEFKSKSKHPEFCNTAHFI